MIIRIVKMTFKPECVEDFLGLFERSKSKIRHQEGCQYLSLLNDKNNTSIFFTYSYWEDEDALNAYRNSETFGEIWPKTKVLFARNAEAWTVSQLQELK